MVCEQFRMHSRERRIQDLRNIRTPNMLPHRVANIEKKVLSINAKYLIASTYRGTQTQRGIELGKDIMGLP